MAEEKKTTLEEAARLYAIPPYMKDIDMSHIDEYPYNPEIEGAFIAGAEWQKEQMLKEAVEGRAEEVTFNNGEKHNTVYYSLNEGTLTSESRIWIPYMGFKDGDKVKIIIVKEKEDKE